MRRFAGRLAVTLLGLGLAAVGALAAKVLAVPSLGAIDPAPAVLSPAPLIHAAEIAQEVPAESPCGPERRDQVLLGSVLHLPILNFLGDWDLCETLISVQNLGRDDAKAILVTWGEPGFCSPRDAGPLKVTCSGLIRPGATWRFSSVAIPNGSKSGVLYRFTTRRLSEIGVDASVDRVVADLICETLFYGPFLPFSALESGSADIAASGGDWSRFRPAIYEGLTLEGIPLDLAAGDGVLAAQVDRECPSATVPGNVDRSAYNAVPGTRLGTCATREDGHRYHVPLVYADSGGHNSIVYVQNAGLECAQVEIWFQAQDGCARRTLCTIEELAPDEAFSFDASACVGSGFRGSAIVRSGQPLAVVTDVVAREALMTYSAQPERLNAAFDPMVDPRGPDGTALYAPIVYNDDGGWRSAITVQSLARSNSVKIVVSFSAENGEVVATVVDWLCAGGSRSFDLAAIADLPRDWRGAARVEAVRGAWEVPVLEHDPAVARIAGVVRSWRDTAGLEVGLGGALAYSMRPEAETIGWDDPLTHCPSPSIVVAMPRLMVDQSNGLLAPDIAILNSARLPGHTFLTFMMFDQNGVVDTECETVSDGQVRILDVTSRGALGGTFSGSAVVSAQYWEHPRFDERGDYLANDHGLISAFVERPIAADPLGRLEDPATGVAGFVVSSTFGKGRGGYRVAPEVDYLALTCLNVPFLRPDCDPAKTSVPESGERSP